MWHGQTAGFAYITTTHFDHCRLIVNCSSHQQHMYRQTAAMVKRPFDPPGIPEGRWRTGDPVREASDDDSSEPSVSWAREDEWKHDHGDRPAKAPRHEADANKELDGIGRQLPQKWRQTEANRRYEKGCPVSNCRHCYGPDSDEESHEPPDHEEKLQRILHNYKWKHPEVSAQDVFKACFGLMMTEKHGAKLPRKQMALASHLVSTMLNLVTETMAKMCNSGRSSQGCTGGQWYDGTYDTWQPQEEHLDPADYVEAHQMAWSEKHNDDVRRQIEAEQRCPWYHSYD